MADKLLRLRQLERAARDYAAVIPQRPVRGWLAEWRRAVLMTGTQMARRLRIDQSTLSRAEQSEAEGTITLQTLERIANSLNCDVRYVLVPRMSLENDLFERARAKLHGEEQRLQTTLALEDQRDEDDQLRDDIRTAMLLHELGSKVWDDD